MLSTTGYTCGCAEMHGSEAVLGIVSVVGQARVVHDLVLHDAAVHEDSMIQTALLAVTSLLPILFFISQSRLELLLLVRGWRIR